MRMILLCGAASLLISHQAQADTYYVAPTGNDGAAGSSSAPWRTIQRAASAVRAGDTVLIAAGTYAGFRVTARGTEVAPIAFVGQGDVRILGSMTDNRDAVLLDGAAWVRIEGLSISGATRAGVAALECHHITVRRNKIDSNGRWGVFSAFCDDLVVEDNEVSRSGSEHGVYASNSADRPVIRRNRIWGNGACGVHMNGDINYGGDGVISGAIVEDNVITGNGARGGSAINGDGITGALIRNNVLDDNHASGISLYRIDGGAPSTGNRVINNTIRMASDSRSAINIQDGSRGNILRNNIVISRNTGRGAIDICGSCLSGTVSERNAFVGRFRIDGTSYDLAGFRGRTGTDATSFLTTEAELFTNAAGGDLTLRAGSPAIDRGLTEDAPATAIDGTRRPQGAGIDLGAYERCEGPCVGAEPGDEPGEGPEPGGEPGDGPGDEPGDEPGDGPGEAPGDEPGNPGAPGDDMQEPSEGGGCSTSPGVGGLAALGLFGLVGRRRRRCR